MPIKRYFSSNNLESVKKDFKFLLNFINKSYGEYELSIRNQCFNLYYKGYSIGKIEPKKDKTYLVSIHSAFFENTNADNQQYYKSKKLSGKYWKIRLTKKNLHPFFQKKHISEFTSRVKDQRLGEGEFEQSIITDNLDREDLIILDRQVTIGKGGRKIDLLALRHLNNSKYKFVLLEIKLGNNKDLQDKVVSQLDDYVKDVENRFNEYKNCYELQFAQKKELGLINKPSNIQIVKPVEGEIVVSGYSRIANENIINLNKKYQIDIIDVVKNKIIRGGSSISKNKVSNRKYPNLKIKWFRYEL